MRALPAALLLLTLAPRLSADDQAAPAGQASSQRSEAEGEAPDREARLTTVEGTVYVHLHDHRDGEFIAAETDSPVEAGDLVRTGTDGHAELTLDGETVIDLSPNTDFLVDSLAKEQTEFHLGIGSIAAKIKSLLGGQKMSFRTNAAVAAVRGTELGVTQQSDASPAEIGVFEEGHVVVTKPDGGGEVHLTPGQETEVSKGKAPAQPRQLRVFEAQRRRMALLRQRQAFHLQNWRRMDLQERRQRRQALRQRQRIRAEKLRGVRADMLRRRYARQQARQRALQKQFQQLRRQRQLRSGQQLRQQRLQQQQRAQQQEKQQRLQQERQKQIQERRRKEAEQHRQELEQRRERQEQERKRGEQRQKIEEERFRKAQAERQRQKEERFRQAQERRQQEIAQRQQQKARKKQQRRTGN